jgi:hypothetical protein
VTLRVVVTLHRNLSTNAEELMKYCAKRLPQGVLPDSIVIENTDT